MVLAEYVLLYNLGDRMSELSCLQLIDRAYLAVHRVRQRSLASLEESIQGRNLSCFLYEQDAVNAQDVRTAAMDINKAADMAMRHLEELLSYLPPGMSNTRNAIGKAKADVAKARLSGASTLSSMLGNDMDDVMMTISNTQILQSSVVNGLTTVYGALNGFKIPIEKKEAASEASIAELVKRYGGRDGAPDANQFEKAIANSLQVGEGLFGKLGKGIKSLFNAVVDMDTATGVFGLSEAGFVQDIMKLTPAQVDAAIGGNRDGLEKMAEVEDDDPLSGIEDVLQDLGLDQADFDALVGVFMGKEPDEPIGPEVTDQEEDTGEEPAGADEGDGYKITRDDLKTLKQAMDTAKGQKKSQTKALGKALNQAVGSTVFMENRLYTRDELFQALTEDKLINLVEDDWGDEGEYSRVRCLKMAGLM